jgi:hypothetical protein
MGQEVRFPFAFGHFLRRGRENRRKNAGTEKKSSHWQERMVSGFDKNPNESSGMVRQQEAEPIEGQEIGGSGGDVQAPEVLDPIVKKLGRVAKGITSVEFPVQTEAFEYYWELQEERSFAAVGKKFGVSQATISAWAKKFDWRNRIVARSKKSLESFEVEPYAQTIETRRTILGLLRAILEKHITIDKTTGKMIVTGIELRSVKDVKDLITAFNDALGVDPKKESAHNVTNATQVVFNIRK